MIDIDSLCEGCDYSSKISKARFDDLGSIPFIQLKQCIGAALTNAGVQADHVTRVIMAGGLSGNPKCNSISQAQFPAAAMHRTRGVDMNEAQAVGAALQGKHLVDTQLVDAAPTGPVEKVVTATNEVSVSSGSGEAQVIIPAGSALPATYSVKGEFDQAQGHLKVLVGGSSVGDVVFNVEGEEKTEVVAKVQVDAAGKICVEVTQTNTGLIIGNLDI